MHLKQIEIKGFKSFPDKMEIVFPKGLIAVVGPNGSGKSNILDAIRWVLGEQSMKSLRSDRSEDVIFSGTQSRKEMTYCEVTLIIDNADQKINMDYTEIGIRRKIFKSGESQFYINNRSCRLKDIKELLLDTGIGKEGYSIISQGKIDELVDGNAIHRRKVVEEAAGITKYRYRKEESQKKLANTKENLQRINDVFFEIEKQIKPLETQKIKAEKYLQLRKQFQLSDINRLLTEYEDFEHQNHLIQQKIQNITEQITQIKQKSIQKEKEKDSLKEESEASISEIETIQRNQIEIEQQLHRYNKEKAVEEERLQHLNTSIRKLQQETVDYESAVHNIRQTSARQEELIRTARKKLNEIQNHWTEQNENHQQLKQRLKKLNSQLEENKAQRSEWMNKQSALRSKIEVSQLGAENRKKHIQTLLGEIQEMQEDRQHILKMLQELEEEIQQLSASLKESESEQVLLKIRLKTESNLRKNCEYKLEQLKSTNRDLASKLNLLKKMEEEMEGVPKGVRELIKNSGIPGIIDSVANVIKVKSGYEKAIESALGASLQHIIVQNTAAAKNSILYLKSKKLGKVTFLPLTTIQGKAMDSIEGGTLAIHTIQFPAPLSSVMEYLLGRVLIVENIDRAICLSEKYRHRFKIVTLDGEIFNIGGSITGGGIHSASNILLRRKQIEEDKTQLLRLEQEEQKIRVELGKLQRQEEKTEQTQKDLSQKHQLLMKKYTEKAAAKNQESLKEQYKMQMITKSRQQLHILQRQGEEDQQLTSGYQRHLLEYEQKLNQLKEESHHLIKTREKDSLLHEESDKNIRELELEKTRLTEVLRSLQQEKIQITQQMDQMKMKQSEINQQKKSDEEIRCKLEKSIENLKKQEEILNRKHKENTVQIESLRKKRLPLVEQIEHIEKQIKESEQLISLENTKKIKAESDRLHLEYRQEVITEKLKTEYQLHYDEALAFRENGIDISASYLENLQKKIASLGNIYLDSIEEYQKVYERYQFYKEQKEDLENSISKIEQLIQSLESNMVKEFKKSFQEINEKFQQVFQLLFDGGQGELVLSDNTQILNSDINIHVQPPGKKLKSISVLSGGEKALSAIALLFAILIRKPVPFCILDEIDAPLDDANIVRFVKLLKLLSKDMQFLTITHRRGTMEASDYIYGVTMREKGVSQIISLKLDEAAHYIEN